MKVPTSHFDEAYAADPDPWRFASSAYEQRRYDLTVAVLPCRRFERAFEPACAIGELSRRLAQRADEVVAMDCSAAVIDEARRRTSVPNVTYSIGSVPADWPDGTFDLVVLSEVGYYFSADLCAALRDRAVGSLRPRGVLMAVHWLGHSTDHLLHGDEVHVIMQRGRGLRHGGGYRDDGFRLDWWERA
jgi:trans-aconitate methyltransferase